MRNSSDGQLTAFVGTGTMGAPVVQRLTAAGTRLRVAVRRPDARAQWVERGVDAVETVAEAAAGAAVLGVLVFDDAQALAVLDEALPHLAPDAIVLLHTTVSLGALAQIDSRCTRARVRLADAPVSGVADDVAAGRLTVLLGASEAVAHELEPLLATYAEPVVHVGAPGTATRLKLVNNLTFAAHVQIAAAAVEIAGGLDVAAEPTVAALREMSAASRAFDHLAAFGADPTALAAKAGPYLAKDVSACLAATAGLGVSVDLLADVVRSGPVSLDPAHSTERPEGASHV